MIEIKNAMDLTQPWTRWFFMGDTGCIAGDQKIRFQVRERTTGRKQDTKGGSMETLFYRFNRIEVKGKGRHLREQTRDAVYTVPCMDEDQRIFHAEVDAVICSGVRECVRVTTFGGRTVVCTPDHPFATTLGYRPIEALGVGASVLVHTGRAWTSDKEREVRARRSEVFVKEHPFAQTKTISSESSRSGEYSYKRLANARFVYEAVHLNGLTPGAYKQRLNDGALAGLRFLPLDHDVHHLDENPLNDDPANLVALSHAEHARRHYNAPGSRNLKYLAEEDEVVSIEPVGKMMTYDIRMKQAPRSFVVEDFVVHNSGKTTCALTFPYPLFVIPSTENSIVTGRGQDVPYVEATGPMELNGILAYLEDAQRKSVQLLAAGKGDAAWAAFPYQTVVVESLSHYTDLIIEEITEGGRTKMDMPKWGVLSSHLRNVHARLSNLPVHVVYTALAEVKEGENSGAATGGALMSGAMKTKLPSACDAIGYCEQTPGRATKENPNPGMNFRVHFQKYRQFAARIRAPRGVVTPPYVDDFHFDKVKGLFGIE